MKKRLLLGAAMVALVATVFLIVWQGSFDLGSFNPTDPQQAWIFWAIAIFIFMMMVILGFILFRELIKLYIASQASREGSRLRTKLVVGALTLTCVPAFFLVIFSFEILSVSVDRWFTNPVEQQRVQFLDVAGQLSEQMQEKVNAQAGMLAAQLESSRAWTTPAAAQAAIDRFAQVQNIESAALLPPSSSQPVASWFAGPAHSHGRQDLVGMSPVKDGSRVVGYVQLTSHVSLDVDRSLTSINEFNRQWFSLKDRVKPTKVVYILLMLLITLFVLFFTTWLALFISKQISVPIIALLDAASEVRKGNLRYRINVRAVDELRSLVRAFNQMTEALESNRLELEERRRFTEAILESIPTGVLSIASDGSVQRANRALARILPEETISRASRLEDLFSREDTAEIKYLMKRARRTGTASRQIEFRTQNRTMHLAVTVSALEEKLTSGFVVVLEDTSELLHAQKAAAWHEVARRVAHEIKNPLTPIALCAERIVRQVERLPLPAPSSRILQECADTITKSVDSVKTLVDEFSQFARFPSAQLVRSDLNEVVSDALKVFQGRLDSINIQTSLAADLPPVNLDREQFARVVVNLVDNAAEAMQDSLVKKLYIATQLGAGDSVELVVADSGSGVSPEDKEKLFLPYFSTKKRGTGLGLAIVSHIVAEHKGQIRVEDNHPAGARFTVEIPTLLEEQLDSSGKPAMAKA